MKWYVGHKKGMKLEAFRSASVPTLESHGSLYVAVVGPFRTSRAAHWAEKYGANNPHLRCVADAEKLSKMAS